MVVVLQAVRVGASVAIVGRALVALFTQNLVKLPLITIKKAHNSDQLLANDTNGVCLIWILVSEVAFQFEQAAKREAVNVVGRLVKPAFAGEGIQQLLSH